LGRSPTWPAEAVESAAAEAGLPALATAARALRSRSNPSALDTIRVSCATGENYWGALFAALCGVLCALENDREITDAMAHDMHAQARRLGVTAGIDRLLAAARQPQALPRLRSAAADRPELSLRCFGEFSIRAGNRVLDCSALRPRARSTFRLLAMNVGQVVHEESIIAALWPDLPPVSARRNLQVAVSAVRGILDTGREPERRSVVERRGGGYVLNLPEGSDSDVLTFSRAIRQWRTGAGGRPGHQGRIRSLLTTALNAYSGELLPEEGQAEWVVAERQRLQFDAADAAVALAELEIGAGNTATASRACRRALQLEPHNDAAWRLLISAYERAGDLAAQVRARRDYAAVLAELGIPESSPREEFHLGDSRGQPGARASA
jgi:DNA-binding SARP family transcriptional activator